MKRSIRIRYTAGALGDVVVLTAAVRDLGAANPDVHIEVDTPFPVVFWNHPAVARHRDPDAELVEITEEDYREMVGQSRTGQPRHFIHAFHDVLTRKTGLPCPPGAPKPALLSGCTGRPVNRPYWLLLAGGKSDMPVKIWDFDRYQQLVNELKTHGVLVVQTGRKEDTHQPLQNTVNMIGVGGTREYFRQVQHCRGVICGLTSGVHLAAAFNKPCVVLAGGREDKHWSHYPGHTYLHSLGQLDCCKTGGCWKKTLPECGNTRTTAEGQILPVCLAEISVTAVVAAVLSYQRTRKGLCEDAPNETC